MAGDAALRLLIDIQARDSASAIVRALGGVFTGLGGGIKGVMAAGAALLGLITLVAAGIAIAIGVVAVRAAANFQQGLNRLVTGAGDVTDNMTKMGQAILGVSIKTGVAANDLIGAMYHILSVGQRGSQALDTLAAASEGAQIEMAKVADVANILVILQTNFGLRTFTATQYMNGLIFAVAHGNITLEALSVAMAPILPLAHQLGISFMDVASAMAVQTNAGLNARQSATGLQAVFVAMANPTKKAELAMRSFGVSSVAVAEEMKKSLPGAFQMLIDAALKVGPIGSVAFNRAMMDMIGGGTRTAKTITALSQNMKAWTNDIKNMAAAMHLSTKDVTGWDIAQSGFNIQLDKGKAAFQALLIVIGTRLLPILSQVLTWVTPLITAFTQWVLKTDPLGKAMAWLATAFDKVKTAAIAVWNFLVPIGKFILATLTPVFQLVGKVITTILIPAWNDFVKAIKPWLPDLLIVAEVLGVILVAAIITVVGVILLIIGAVLLVIGIFLALVAAILFAANWIREKVNWLVNTVVGFFVWLWHQLVGGSIIPALVAAIIFWFAHLRDMLIQLVNYVVGWIVAQWQHLKTESEVLWNALVFVIQGKLNQIKQAVLNIIGQAFAWGQNLVNNILKGIQSAWAGLMSWVNGALTSLKNLFPHSPVKEGPLKGYENWGYTFGMGIADGIRRSIPAVQSASNMLASAMGGNYSGSYSLSGSSFGGGRYPSGSHTIVIMPPGPTRSPIYLDKREVGYQIMDWAGTDARRHGGPQRR